MTHVVHIIHSLTLGGAARTMIATAKYSAQLGDFKHSLVMLDLHNSDPRAAEFALKEGMNLLPARNREELLAALESADIVQVNWWQHPDMDNFLRSELPPMRLLGWFHVAGDAPPQVLTDELVSYFDLVLGGSSYTYFAPSIWRLSTEERLEKTDFVVGGADFARLANFKKEPHSNFNIGYIGTVNPTKMYPRFVPMHASLDIPKAKVIVCGGDHHIIMGDEAAKLGLGDLFDFRGYVSDIGEVLAALDVYGYPLCHNTYAASELNLQEAMYAGIPPVVFPHGGIKTLVVNEFNGLVVHTEKEYIQALEHLYNNPEERLRLGGNAALFAREMFGAERHAAKMNRMYQRILQKPKRSRMWPGYLSPGVPARYQSGAEIFLQSLGQYGEVFKRAYLAETLEEILQAEIEILHCSEIEIIAGILPYRGYYPEDPHLKLWSALGLLGLSRGSEGAGHLIAAKDLGLGQYSWRVYLYLAAIAEQYGDTDLKEAAFLQIKNAAPDFDYLAASNVLASSLASRPSNRPL